MSEPSMGLFLYWGCRALSRVSFVSSCQISGRYPPASAGCLPTYATVEKTSFTAAFVCIYYRFISTLFCERSVEIFSTILSGMLSNFMKSIAETKIHTLKYYIDYKILEYKVLRSTKQNEKATYIEGRVWGIPLRFSLCFSVLLCALLSSLYSQHPPIFSLTLFSVAFLPRSVPPAVKPIP